MGELGEMMEGGRKKLRVGDTFESSDGTKIKVTHTDGFLGVTHLDRHGNIMHPDSPRANTEEQWRLIKKIIRRYRKQK